MQTGIYTSTAYTGTVLVQNNYRYVLSLLLLASPCICLYLCVL